MKPSIRIQEEICLSVGLTEEAKTRYLINIVCKILDEHAEAIERLEKKSEEYGERINWGESWFIGNLANKKFDISSIKEKPKSLTLEEIEAVIDDKCAGWDYLKQAFRDKLK